MTDTAVFPPRERVMHPMKIRNLAVTDKRMLSDTMVRITVAGPDLADFTSPGPGDHVKVFFPDDEGVLHAPVMTEEGIKRPERDKLIARDYTPVEYRPEELELDLDFVLHDHGGPAATWAATAQAGDGIAVGGPRGSLLPPEAMGSVVIVADETAFPATKRWLGAVGVETPTTLLLVSNDPTLSTYFDDVISDFPSPLTVQWFSGPNCKSEVEEALRAVELDSDTFAFLAGEAGMLIPLRRYLRRERGLERSQVDAQGYWRVGVAEADHHAPLDPSDPD